MVHETRIKTTHGEENSNHNLYRTWLVARNKIKLSNSERNNVEPSDKSKTLEPSVEMSGPIKK